MNIKINMITLKKYLSKTIKVESRSTELIGILYLLATFLFFLSKSAILIYCIYVVYLNLDETIKYLFYLSAILALIKLMIWIIMYIKNGGELE